MEVFNSEYTAAQFEMAIKGAGVSGNPDDDVCFWDYEGTLVYSCSLEEAHNMTELPAPPDHSQDDIPLTFVEWNYMLEEIQTLTRKADVGAMYKAEDNNVHFHVRLTKTTGLSVTINWSYFGNGAVDWGDGTVDTIAAVSGSSAFSHDYTEYGTYHVVVSVGGNPGSTSTLLADNSMLVGTAIISRAGWDWPNSQAHQLFCKSNVEAIVLPPTAASPTGKELFTHCYKLKHLNIPRTFTTILSMSSSYNVQRVSIPNAATTFADYAFASTAVTEVRLPANANISTDTRFQFAYCRNLTSIELPEGKTTVLPMRAFRECYGLKEITIPASVTALGGEVFYNAGVLDYYFYPTTPPTINTTDFTGIGKNTVIHVPADSLEAYQTATNWATYIDYMVGDL